MYDKIEKIGQSTIQHGKNSNRIYLMELDKRDYPAIVKKLDLLAAENNYTKIFTKIPSWAIDSFQTDGYVKEAFIPNYYFGKFDAYFFSKFIDGSRSILEIPERKSIEKHIKMALSKQGGPILIRTNPSFEFRFLNEGDISNLVRLYHKVFRSYPFPIFEEEYVKKTMNENIIYFGIFHGKKLIATSSAEIGLMAKNAEMTDFATDPDYAGNSLSLVLLKEMEAEMRMSKIKTVYTIARTNSVAMNITFAKQDYTYSGTLINNTNISGNIESMNVWHKSLI